MGLLPIDATTAVIGGAALVIGIWYFRSKKRNLPPGPTPMPIVGNLLQVGKFKSLLEALYTYQKQYGNIFMFYAGSHPTIVICGEKLIREALVSNADYFSSRPSFLTIPKTVSQHKGIIWDPHNWKANRKSSLVSLRDFGFGKRSLEERVHDEARALCEYLDTFEGQVVQMRPHLTKAFSNVICTIVFGQRFEYDNPRFVHLMELLDLAFSNTGDESSVLDHMPFLIHLPKYKAQYDNLIKLNTDIEDYIKEIIEEHRQSFVPDNPRDFIDHYLQTDPTNELNALIIIKELFFAGTETSGTSLTWALLLMAKHPEIQKKCRQEIKQVIGLARGPKSTDKGMMPYVEATIQEVQRYVSIAPVALPHSVTEDCKFAGYDLKKDSIVIAFLDSCHHDPEVWPDHDEFRPERWLDSNGKFDPKHSSFVAFSVGRRACLGEQLAKMELFIMFVSVLQRFEFSPVPNKQVSLEGHLGITYAPVDDSLVYQKRDP